MFELAVTWAVRQIARMLNRRRVPPPVRAFDPYPLGIHPPLPGTSIPVTEAPAFAFSQWIRAATDPMLMRQVSGPQH